MISKKLALEILNIGLSTGADYSEIFIQATESFSQKVENGISEKPAAMYDVGAGIRLLKGLESIYGFTNDLTKKGLLKLVNNLAASFNGKRILTVTSLKRLKTIQLSPIKKHHRSIQKIDKIELLRKANKVLKDYDPRIVRAITVLNEVHAEVFIFNSLEKEVHDTRTYSRLGISAFASENGQIEANGDGPGAQMGYEFAEGFDTVKAAKEVARVAISLLSAKECPSGRMPVVIGNGFGGVLFHEACGHSLEATAVSRGLSVFSGKEGQLIASPLVNAFDNGIIPNAWGTINYDDEGNLSQNVQLIKNGVLNEYMIDMFNGRRMGKEANGHSRRQNYRYEPTSRMTNTYIDNGTSTVEEIISATKLGLYAKSMGGGSVNPTTGEFNFGCNEAYIIRDGKVAEQVKGAILIGTGEEILKEIDMVGNDLKFAQGVCGSSSGSVNTIVGQPTIRVKSMVVGGRGGELK